MPKHDFRNIGEVVDAVLLDGIITSLNDGEDTCTVDVTLPEVYGGGEETFENVPIYYHCHHDAEVRGEPPNRALVDAASAFCTDDEVIVQMRVENEKLVAGRVISHKEEKRSCIKMNLAITVEGGVVVTDANWNPIKFIEEDRIVGYAARIEVDNNYSRDDHYHCTGSASKGAIQTCTNKYGWVQTWHCCVYNCNHWSDHTVYDPNGGVIRQSNRTLIVSQSTQCIIGWADYGIGIRCWDCICHCIDNNRWDYTGKYIYSPALGGISSHSGKLCHFICDRLEVSSVYGARRGWVVQGLEQSGVCEGDWKPGEPVYDVVGTNCGTENVNEFNYFLMIDGAENEVPNCVGQQGGRAIRKHDFFSVHHFANPTDSFQLPSDGVACGAELGVGYDTWVWNEIDGCSHNCNAMGACNMEGSSWEQIVEGQDWNPTKCYPYDHNRCQTTYGGPYEWNTFSNNTDKTREVWLFKCSVGPRWWESHNYDYDWIGCYFADSVEQYKDEFGAAIAAGHQAFIQLARGATFGGKATSHPQPVIVEYLSRGKRDE